MRRNRTSSGTNQTVLSWRPPGARQKIPVTKLYKCSCLCFLQSRTDSDRCIFIMPPMPAPPIRRQTVVVRIAGQVVPAVAIAISLLWIKSAISPAITNYRNWNTPWACYKRDRAYVQLLEALYAARAHAGATSSGSRIRTRPNEPPRRGHFDGVRAAARRVRAVANLCTRKADPPGYGTFEWSVTSRYSTDGVLNLLAAVLGSDNGTLLAIDSGKEDSRAKVVHAPAVALDMNHLEVTHVTEALKFNRRGIFSRGDADSARISNTVDAVALFLDDGSEAEAIARFSQASILVVHYRDFLGPELALWREKNSADNPTPEPLDADGVDPVRPLPSAGYSLRGIAALAGDYGYRLVWCLEHAPVAFFVRTSNSVANRFFPTRTVNACWQIRANDSKFLDRMADLWHKASGHKWKQMHGLFFWRL